MKKTLRWVNLLLMSATLVGGVTSCEKMKKISSNGDAETATEQVAEAEAAEVLQTAKQTLPPIQVTESGQISTDYQAGQEVSVSFDRFPVDYDDWARAQAQLGHSLAGTVALELMAMQLYYYDQAEGEKAIYACNTEVDAKGMIRLLQQKFMQSKANKGDNYVQPYLVASYLEGASPQNAYHPNTPYEIKVRMSPVNKPQEGQISYTGIDYFLQINCNGADTNWRGIEVAELKGEEYFKVFNNASIAVGVKQIAYKSNPEDFDELR